ncbi:hypothetical protein NFI96_005637 [Prochilodus magdalenae]|nr:hypothetical protein NFI96_005637 [Prochilodus magdalenae]
MASVRSLEAVTRYSVEPPPGGCWERGLLLRQRRDLLRKRRDLLRKRRDLLLVLFGRYRAGVRSADEGGEHVQGAAPGERRGDRGAEGREEQHTGEDELERT